MYAFYDSLESTLARHLTRKKELRTLMQWWEM